MENHRLNRLSLRVLAVAFMVLGAVGGFISQPSQAAQPPIPSMETKDIVETAVGAGTFNTLAKALEAAGLVDALKGEGPLTVFAPTDEAFAKLPAGTLEELLKPENKDKLRAILLYHVVSGKFAASDVVKLNGREATTLQGGKVSIKVKNGVMVDNARVMQTDVMASNGVIHVIDTVLMPKLKSGMSSDGGRMGAGRLR